uniref:NADH dehydrogenase subunit 4L n=1 Tax=Atractolytocestus huronensis TaxID=507542 RepID=A0A343ESS9_9CEST|nr:NADH dehydrogenase subunit 4L [Atractolytocestus huronensis]ASL24615.1 NADH dehydrogenase subunit 4L [Atractolytocestus huronensis]
MVALFLVVFTVVSLGLVLSVGRFLSCLIILENFNVLILLFSLIMTSADSHMLFVVLMVVSTIEVVVGLIVLTRLWEFGGRLDSVGA